MLLAVSSPVEPGVELQLPRRRTPLPILSCPYLPRNVVLTSEQGDESGVELCPAS